MAEMRSSLVLQFVLTLAATESSELGQEPLEEHVFSAMLRTCGLTAKDLLPNGGDLASVQKEIDEIGEKARTFAPRGTFKEAVSSLRRRFRSRLKAEYPTMPHITANALVSGASELAEEQGMQIMPAPFLMDYMIQHPTPIIREFTEGTDQTVTDKIKQHQRELENATRMTWSLEARLLQNVKGQNDAIYAFVNGISSALIFQPEEEGKRSPRGIFVFAGPPGSGKTYLAEQAAMGLGLPYLRLDMSEYVTDDSAMELFGREQVYVNAREGILTGYVKSHPSCVLIFDEIEKAAPAVINEFLQILDAGRLTDHNTRKTVSFADAFIIFTSNAGRSLYEGDRPMSGQVSKEVILEALRTETDPDTGRTVFPPAICSRLGTGYVVLFNHLGPQDLVDIANEQLRSDCRLYSEKYGITVEADELIPVILLLSCGGDADARRLRSETERFFKEEIFKIGNYLGRRDFSEKLARLSKIRFDVPSFTGIPELDEWTDNEHGNVLIEGSYAMLNVCEQALYGTYDLYETESFEEAERYVSRYDYLFTLIEMPSPGEVMEGTINGLAGTPITAAYLRDLVRFLGHFKDEHPEAPVYLMRAEGGRPLDELLMSELQRIGVQLVMTIHPGQENKELKRLKEAGRQLRLQAAADSFARERKKLVFETAPLYEDDGSQIIIRVRNFSVVNRISGEDAAFIRTADTVPDISFDDVIGEEDAKAELRSCIRYLRSPGRAAKEGRQMPRGILLYGPPGTGKTYLARALAHEAGVPFIPANGSDFVNYYVGSGAGNVRELFARARRYAPSIVFIDEIDAIGVQRSGEAIRVEQENALNALLYELDGFGRDEKRPVFVIAATNFPIVPTREEPVALDKALVRRFDRRIRVDLPGLEERETYLSRLTGEELGDVSKEALADIARRSVGMNYSELQNVVSLAVRLAEDEGEVMDDDWLDKALEQERFGEEKEWNEEYLHRVAVHESGHAIISYLTGRRPEYISIVAREDIGGYVQDESLEDKPVLTRKELLGLIDGLLGGRAAELVFYGPEEGLSTGAGSDLPEATSLAYDLVCTYGMDEKCGPAVYCTDPEKIGPFERERVDDILKEEMEETQKMIEGHLPEMNRLIEKLLEKNHLSSEEICEILAQQDQ